MILISLVLSIASIVVVTTSIYKVPKLEVDAVIGINLPQTFEIILTHVPFSINQYIFIEKFGIFVINEIVGNKVVLFNLQQLNNELLKTGLKVYSSGDTIYTLTTKDSTIADTSFNIFVRDAENFVIGESVSISSSAGGILDTAAFVIQLIAKPIKSETRIILSNPQNIDVGRLISSMSKVTPTGTKGTPGSAGGPGGVAFFEFDTGSTKTYTLTGNETTIDVNTTINLNVTNGTPDIYQIIYFNASTDGIVFTNYYWESKTHPNNNLVDIKWIESFNGTPPMSFLVLDETPIYFAPIDTNTIAAGNLTSLDPGHMFVGNASGIPTGVPLTGAVNIDEGGLTVLTANSVNSTTIAAGTLTNALNVSAGGSTLLTNNAVTPGVIAAGTIVNIDVSGTAAISLSKLQNITGPTFLGRSTGTGSTQQLTSTTATSILNSFSGTLKGLVPTGSGNDSNKSLRGDGSWTTVTTGTVTNVSTTVSDGIVATVTNPTTTPQIAFSLTNNSISLSKLQNITGPTFLGRSTGTGSTEQLTSTTATSILNSFSGTLKGLVPTGSGNDSNKSLRGDGSWTTVTTGTVTNVSTTVSDGIVATVTNPTTTPQIAFSLTNNSISLSKLQNITGPTFLGRSTGTGSTEQLTSTTATSILNSFSGTLKGLVPTGSGNDSNKSLRGDGSWTTVTTGTVTNVSTTVSQGIIATVTNPTTTPQIAFSLNIISPNAYSVSGLSPITVPWGLVQFLY